jgi:aerobic carbon-monoxide dehydrogenase large subunit
MNQKARGDFKPTRREDEALLRGRGQFVHNLTLPDLLFVAFARSDYACGVIERLEVSQAKAMPQVVAILGVEELGRHFMPAVNPLLKVNQDLSFPLLADGQIQAVGQVLAVVVARSAAAAKAAAQLVQPFLKDSIALIQRAAKSDVEENDGEPVQSLREDFSETESATEVEFVRGERADPAALKVSVNLNSPRVQAFAMEPRASMAQWDERDHTGSIASAKRSRCNTCT